MCEKEEDAYFRKMVSEFIYAPCESLSKELNKPTEEVIYKIIETPLDYILSIVDEGEIEYCSTRYIPQYSDLNSAIIMEINYLAENGSCSLEKIGSILPKQITDSVCARVKYGENHSKLLETFGLAQVQNSSVQLTEMGFSFSQLELNERIEYIKRSIFRTPIIRNILIKSEYQVVSVKNELLLFLSESTAKRRLANVCDLIKLLESSDQPNIKNRLHNIKRR